MKSYTHGQLTPAERLRRELESTLDGVDQEADPVEAGDRFGAGQSAPDGERADDDRDPRDDVAAPVVELGLNPDRTLEVPRSYGDAGWWSGGAAPEEPVRQ